MTEESKGMKIAVLVFAAALIIVAVAAAGVSAEQQKTCFPVNGSIGDVVIDWYYPDYEELVLRSDLIVVATVSDKFTVWGTEDGEKPPRYALCDYWIYTCYPCDEFEVLKGNVSRLCVRAPGGTADGYTLNADPVPEFEVGDKVLLFLTTNYDESGNYTVWYHVGMSNVFTETEGGIFVNDYYGGITAEQVKENIAAAQKNYNESVLIMIES